MSSPELERKTHILLPLARGVLRVVLNVGGAWLLAACASPAKLTDAELDAYAADLRITSVSTPAPEPTSIPATFTPVPSPTPRPPEPTATPDQPTAKPVIETVSQEEALVMIKAIADAIKNPDPEVVKKYNISPQFLANEQAAVLYGGTDKGGTSNLPKTQDGHSYIPDSLAGVEALIREGDLVSAKAFIKKLFPTVRNASFRDVVAIRMSLEEALKLDPDKLFVNFPPLPNRPFWGGSEVKKDAAIGLINLYYRLPS